MSYVTFMPNYYSTLVQVQSAYIALDNIFWFIADGTATEAVADSNPKTMYDQQIVANQIMYGCRILPHNMLPMIRRVDWTPNTAYAKYDSRDPDLGSKDFFVISSNNAIYKCIDNNQGALSLQEPSSLIPGYFTLSDGYTWQYMFKLTESEVRDLSYPGYIPIIPDMAAIGAAVKGEISTIEVNNGGYYPYTDTGIIQTVVSNNVVRIANTAVINSGTYQDMAIYIKNGPGVGEISQISDYTANTMGRFVTTTSPLTGITNYSEYEIVPFIKIEGNGADGTARAIMNESTVDKIEVINRGSLYTLSTATLQANTVFGTPGQLEVNLSPPKGSGADPFNDLYSDTILFHVNLDNHTVADSVPVNQLTFSKVGMVRFLVNRETNNLYEDSTFHNVFIANLPASTGSFEKGNVIRLVGAADGNPSAEVVFANNTHVVGVYHSLYGEFNEGNLLESENGTRGAVLSITQPQVRMDMADMVAIINTNTLERDENSKETLKLLLKIRR